MHADRQRQRVIIKAALSADLTRRVFRTDQVRTCHLR